MPTESDIAVDLDALRRMPGIIRVPIPLWFPDEEAVVYARLGKVVRIVAAKQTRALRAGFAPARFRGSVTQSARGRDRQIQLWAKELPQVMPNEVFRILFDGLDGAPLAVRFEFKGEGQFDLVFAIGTPESFDFLALVERRFQLGASTVEHYWMRVDSSSQQRGMAARVISALLPLYERLGIYTVRITAGLSAGGAVWGKFGFVPDREEWIKMSAIIHTNIRAIMLRRDLPPQIVEACEAAAWLSGDKEPRNYWLINDLAGSQTLDGERLGAVLLRGVRWKGSLSFADKEAVNRLRDRFSASGVSSFALDSLAVAATAAF